MGSQQQPVRARSVYVSHGGGPLPLLGDPAHRELVDHLKNMAVMIARPAAIIVVSAHWEEEQVTITSHSAPPLIYDYYGFPEQSYRISYPVAGHPELAGQIATALAREGIPAQLDNHRGFDHGLFVPLKIMYPDANIPCVQLSLAKGLDPALHIRIGEVLATLDLPDVLVMGSGYSFHNMKVLLSSMSEQDAAMNQAFEAWLIDCCSSQSLSETQRRAQLENWSQAPFARFCHPREEHLLPLHVCYGVAGRACRQVFELTVSGEKISSYLW